MRRILLVSIIVLLAIGATVTVVTVRWRPVVAFAYTRPSAVYLDLARAALEARGTRIPTFLYDSMAATETSNSALAFAAELVLRSDVAIVVGPSNSRHALATAPAYNAASLAQIVPSATNRRLRDVGPSTFTLVPDDSVEGEFLARFARKELGARRDRRGLHLARRDGRGGDPDRQRHRLRRDGRRRRPPAAGRRGVLRRPEP